jgi:AP-1 complex subunit gamma-1
MYQDIQKLIASTNLFIKKKATIAAVRIIRKVPDMVDEFAKLVENLLQERNHGVQLATFALMREILQVEASYKTKFKKLIPTLIKAHKQLLSGGYTPDYDISGVLDPFLQVSILHVLRLLGEQDADASEEMYDLLTQVASNPDSGKTATNAILYECARTIVSVESSAALKTLGINILGKFLANKDSNTRYVALELLKKVVRLDYDAVQRHKATILDCVKEKDISIRKGALDLLSQLVNKTNVKSVVKEILNFIIVADPEFQVDLAATICWATEKYAPSVRWQIDTIINVLKLAGTHVKDEHIYNLIHVITASPSQCAYSVHSAYLALKDNLKQEGLVLFAIWMIGEFGHFLRQPYNDNMLSAQAVESDEILGIIETIIKNPKTTSKIRDYALTGLIKLSVKLPGEHLERINELIGTQMNWPASEVQQRSLEYTALLDAKFKDKRRQILESIPLSRKAEALARREINEEDGDGVGDGVYVNKNQNEAKESNDLIDLLADQPIPVVEKKENTKDTLNILEDLFSNLPSTNPVPEVSGVTASNPVASPPNDVLFLCQY